MIMIAAVDRNWAIGKDGRLLAHISRDLKHFAQMTTGHVIVMGRKTLESFPGGKPLPNRVNIVLTSQEDYDGKGALVARGTAELDRILSSYESEEIYIVGGESLYRMMLPRCDRAVITKIDAVFDADAWMPNLDREPDWFLSQEGETLEEKGLSFRFCLYVKHDSSEKKGEHPTIS